MGARGHTAREGRPRPAPAPRATRARRGASRREARRSRGKLPLRPSRRTSREGGRCSGHVGRGRAALVPADGRAGEGREGPGRWVRLIRPRGRRRRRAQQLDGHDHRPWRHALRLPHLLPARALRRAVPRIPARGAARAPARASVARGGGYAGVRACRAASRAGPASGREEIGGGCAPLGRHGWDACGGRGALPFLAAARSSVAHACGALSR